MVLALFVGILAGTWLAEIGGNTPYGHVVRFLNDVLLSAPSILVGLFVYQLLVAPLHGFSGWAGAIALALLATPIVTRTTEDILNLQQNALREAGMAMGGSQFHHHPQDHLEGGRGRPADRRSAGFRTDLR